MIPPHEEEDSVENSTRQKNCRFCIVCWILLAALGFIAAGYDLWEKGVAIFSIILSVNFTAIFGYIFWSKIGELIKTFED